MQEKYAMTTMYEFNTAEAVSTDIPTFPLYVDFTQIRVVYCLFAVISALIIAIGIVGNAMVIIVVLKNRSMRTPTNYYIVSLAISDLCVTAFVMPMKLFQLMSGKVRFGHAMCTVVEFLSPFFIFTSIWTLVSISVDRYLVIIHPLKSRSFNTMTRAFRNLVIIWIVPFFLLSPYIIFPFQANYYILVSHFGSISRVVCNQRLPEWDFIISWKLVDRVLMLCFLYLIPFILLGFTCGSIARRLLRMTEDDKMLKSSVKKEDTGRKKVAKMVLVVVLAFWICWTPLFLTTWIAQINENIFDNGNYIFVQLIIFACAFLNSCLNPIIYALMSRAFRRGFWEILTCCCPRYRYLVGNPRGRSDRRQQSVTAMSASEGGAQHSDYPNRRRKQLMASKEVTHVTRTSNSDGEDDFCMNKMTRNNNNSFKTKGFCYDKKAGDGNKSSNREKLLHNLLDDNALKGTDQKGNAYSQIDTKLSPNGETPSSPLLTKVKNTPNLCEPSVQLENVPLL